MEGLFALIKNKVDIKGIDLLDNTCLFTAYTDDLTFFLKDISSVKLLVETVKEFSRFSGLKCQIAGLPPPKGFLEAVCGLKIVDLTNGAIKILG